MTRRAAYTEGSSIPTETLVCWPVGLYRIRVEYVPPTNPAHQPLYELLTGRRRANMGWAWLSPWGRLRSIGTACQQRSPLNSSRLIPLSALTERCRWLTDDLSPTSNYQPVDERHWPLRRAQDREQLSARILRSAALPIPDHAGGRPHNGAVCQ